MPRKGENIRKRKDGRWEGRISYLLPTGKRKVYSVYAKTYSDVKRKQNMMRAELIKLPTGNVVLRNGLPSDLSVGAVAEKWLADVSNSGKHSTYVKYRNIYRLYISPHLADKAICMIGSEELEKVMKENTGMSASILGSIRTVLKHILTYEDVHCTLQIPMLIQGKRSEKSKKPEIFPVSEQSILLTYLEKHMERTLLGSYICIFTGIRLGEVCSLKWSDIDLKAKLMYINTTVQRIAVDGGSTKTALVETEPKSSCSKRTIPIPEKLLNMMYSYKNDDIYVISGNRPMEPRRYENIWKGCLKKAGISYRNFHCLRHTFATNCVESGIDVKSLSEILGHSDVRITLNRYVHPSMESKRTQLDHMVRLISNGSYEGSEKWS